MQKNTVNTSKHSKKVCFFFFGGVPYIYIYVNAHHIHLYIIYSIYVIMNIYTYIIIYNAHYTDQIWSISITFNNNHQRSSKTTRQARGPIAHCPPGPPGVAWTPGDGRPAAAERWGSGCLTRRTRVMMRFGDTCEFCLFMGFKESFVIFEHGGGFGL